MPAIITRGAFSAKAFGFAGAKGGRTVIQVFTATQNWTAPTGVTSVDYLVVAGGGGGGAGQMVLTPQEAVAVVLEDLELEHPYP